MNASTCGGGFCRHDPNCSRRNCKGHPRQTEEYDEREARLSVAMNQPITHDGGMAVDYPRNEPAEWPDVWEWIGDMTKAAPWVAVGIAVVVALLWAIYQLWPILVASI